jgi:hypothetical protein
MKIEQKWVLNRVFGRFLDVFFLFLSPQSALKRTCLQQGQSEFRGTPTLSSKIKEEPSIHPLSLPPNVAVPYLSLPPKSTYAAYPTPAFLNHLPLLSLCTYFLRKYSNCLGTLCPSYKTRK